MPELDLTNEINIAIKAALTSGKYLKKNKIELNKTASSDPRDTKLEADKGDSAPCIPPIGVLAKPEITVLYLIEVPLFINPIYLSLIGTKYNKQMRTSSKCAIFSPNF